MGETEDQLEEACRKKFMGIRRLRWKWETLSQNEESALKGEKAQILPPSDLTFLRKQDIWKRL